MGVYLCLRPNPSLESIPWLPKSLTHWADRHGRLDNVPAFAALALPFMYVCNGRRARRKALAWLAVFAAVLELLQYFIPTRHCEWQDIVASWAGLAITWLGVEFTYRAAWRVRQFFKQPQDGRPPDVFRPAAAGPKQSIPTPKKPRERV
jgi:VanZ family protein